MNSTRTLLSIFAAAALIPAAAFAQKIVLTAEIEAAQEVGEVPSTSMGVGEAVMNYDFDTNTFDLEVRIRGLTEDIAASHIHEALPGQNGPVVLSLGGEDAYKRSGERVRLKLRRQTYTGNPDELLTGGAYLNFHTATFPGGAIRGQLLPHSADFITNLRPLPGVASKARGVARVRYNFLDETIDARVMVSNIRTNLTQVSIVLDGVSAGGLTEVVLGGPGGNSRRGKTYHLNFQNVVVPDPVEGDDGDFLMAMLSGNTSVLVRSETYPDGETRGKLRFLRARRH